MSRCRLFWGCSGGVDRGHACPTNAVVGCWECLNALGTNQTARMTIVAVGDSPCTTATAAFVILGAAGQYVVTVLKEFDAPDAKALKGREPTLKMRLYNWRQNYSHEALYDASTDVLVEDLSHVNGNFVGGTWLEFRRCLLPRPP